MKTKTRKPRAKKRKKTAIISQKEMLAGVPGYDPVATAGDCRFNYAKAKEVIAFFHSCLRNVKGEMAGKLLVLEPWQQAILGNLYGWIRSDGTRRFREALIYVPRKQGKTTILSGLVLWHLFCDGELGAEV